MGKQVYMIYYSKTGNTKALAEKIAEMFRAEAKDSIDLEMMEAPDFDIDALRRADGYIIGTPDYFSYVAGQVKIFFDEMYSYRDEIQNRPTFGFLSHGGKGRAIRPLQRLCKSLKLHVLTPFISVKNSDFTPRLDQQITRNCQILQKFLQVSKELP